MTKLQMTLASHPVLGSWVDTSLPPPTPMQGSGPIRLIVLGQDPTVKNPESRKDVKTVLNLDRGGSLRKYIEGICTSLSLDLDANVYATNYVNVFFTAPPASCRDPDILTIATESSLPLLLEELRPYAGVPVLTLGEPLLQQIVMGDAPRLVRDYWGYSDQWKTGHTEPFRHLAAADNRLQREVFPFPHQPSIIKAFYRDRLEHYLGYMREKYLAVRDVGF